MAYSYSDITFLENPFSFSVALKSLPERKNNRQHLFFEVLTAAI